MLRVVHRFLCFAGFVDAPFELFVRATTCRRRFMASDAEIDRAVVQADDHHGYSESSSLRVVLIT
jgi:hypothetical protein